MASLFSHVRIRPPLDADFRRGAVAGEHGDVVAEREDFFADAAEEQFAIPAGQIPAPDAAREEHVPAEKNAIFFRQKTQAAGAVAGDEQYLEVDAFDFFLTRILRCASPRGWARSPSRIRSF